MSALLRALSASVLASAVLLAGCVGGPRSKPYDYANFRAHPPRSILVLPPLNESMTVEGTYGYLSTVTRPIAERGYYVFPVAVTDQFMKDNGLPTAGEMQDVPLAKFAEVIGADAVLFLKLKHYGSTYHVVNATTKVEVLAKLVDTRTGILLWEGRGIGQQDSARLSNPIATLIAAALTQAINSQTDNAHNVSRMANENLFGARGRGLPYGPYSPKYRTER
jgi:hypothetical protein